MFIGGIRGSIVPEDLFINIVILKKIHFHWKTKESLRIVVWGSKRVSNETIPILLSKNILLPESLSIKCYVSKTIKQS